MVAIRCFRRRPKASTTHTRASTHVDKSLANAFHLALDICRRQAIIRASCSLALAGCVECKRPSAEFPVSNTAAPHVEIERRVSSESSPSETSPRATYVSERCASSDNSSDSTNLCRLSFLRQPPRRRLHHVHCDPNLLQADNSAKKLVGCLVRTFPSDRFRRPRLFAFKRRHAVDFPLHTCTQLSTSHRVDDISKLKNYR